MEAHTEKKSISAQAGKTLRGTVVGVAMKDTATVAVARYMKHPKYKKFIKKVKKYLVHDPENTASVGDTVVIRETRPISRRKSFIIESNATAAK